jgi:beta-glucosidase
VASLDLTGRQEELLEAVHATGTPTVLVLVNGRPLSIRWAAEHVPAILEAWLPGERGGEAVADVLFGDQEPEGRLPITFPRHVGQLPVAYDHKPSKAYWIREGWGKPYADMSPEPLFEFGHGLSYTRFSYANLRVAPDAIRSPVSVEVSVDVANVGTRPGKEVVELYLRDPIASVVVPVQRLRGFEKVALGPGETRTVRLTLHPDDLALLDADLRRVVEPGAFEVAVGSSSRKIHLTGRFEVLP